MNYYVRKDYREVIIVFTIFNDKKGKTSQEEILQSTLGELGDVHETVIHNLKKNPSMINDRQALHNMLDDCLFDNPVGVDLLMMAYDENIIDDAKKYLELIDPQLNKFIEILTNKYSISKVYAAWSIITWYKILEKEVPDDIINRINLDSEQLITTKTLQKYEQAYSEEGFKEKLTSNVKELGEKIITPALQLFYAAKSDKCPVAAKAAILAALGYFILPVDLIPDFVPVVGYGDDLSVLSATVAALRSYITDAVRLQAANTLKDLMTDGNFFMSI